MSTLTDYADDSERETCPNDNEHCDGPNNGALECFACYLEAGE